MPIYDLSYDPQDPLYDAPGLPGVRWAIQVFTVRNLYGLDPACVELVQSGDGVRLRCHGLSWAGQQQRSAGAVEADVIWKDGSLTWRIRASHEEPIKSIKLLLRGLPEAALAQGWWHATSGATQVEHPTANAPLHWIYPIGHQWLTPWACAGTDGAAVCLSIRDDQVREKRLYVHQPPYAAGGSIVEVVCEQDAVRWGSHCAAPPIYLRLCQNGLEVDMDWEAHLASLEQAYGLRPWEARADVPNWLRDIRLVLNLHGQHWTGYVFNSFERMAETLKFVTRHINGKHVLAWLPGWQSRYYFSFPDFHPAKDLGGAAGFRRLVATARALNVQLMPMFGAHGANAQMYPDWERAIFRNATNRFGVILNDPDWDGDRRGEGDQIFLNPGEPNYRRHLVEQVSAAVNEYGFDIVNFDTTAAWFNDPRYNLYEGYQALLDEVRRRHPTLAVAGEGWNDALLGLFPINLRWIETSNFRRPDLLARYARTVHNINEGAPGPGSTGVYERGFRPNVRTAPTAGHLPSLSIVDDTLERYAEEVAQICESAARR